MSKRTAASTTENRSIEKTDHCDSSVKEDD